MKKEIIIIGVGNAFRSDDGVGIVIAQKLKAKNIDGIEVIEESGEGVSLMNSWENFDHVIIVDAVSSGEKAGTIYYLDAINKEIPKSFFNYSTHAFSVAESIELSRVLGNLPQKLFIYGIEGKDFSAGQTLSPEIEEASLKVIDQIINSLEEKKNA